VVSYGCVDGSVWVNHVRNPDISMSFFGHTESVSCGSFTPDGKYLISGSDDLSVKVWDLKNQVILYTIKGKKYHQAAITGMSIAKKKSIVATCSVENEIGVTNYESGNVNILNNIKDTKFNKCWLQRFFNRNNRIL
jgi:WD40 repeat protein